MATRERSNELSSFMQSLDVELMCGICLEFFEVPIMLPCGHNFCRKCIHHVVDSGHSFNILSIGPPTGFNCPICQMDISMSAKGVDNLPVNKPLESIIALYQSFSPVDIFDLAWNSDIKIDVRTCPDHKEPMNKYCESCSETACRKCERELHSKRHRISSLFAVASTLQADIADTLTEIKKKTLPVYERMELLGNMLETIESEEKNIKKSLSHKMEAMQSSIRAKQVELSNDIENRMTDASSHIHKQLKKCKLYRTKVQEMMKKLSAIRKIRDVNQRIKLMKDTILQLNIMLQDDSDWSAEYLIPHLVVPDLKLQTQDIITMIADLHWTGQDPAKKTTCTTCTQTENLSMPDETGEHADNPILTVNQNKLPENSTDKQVHSMVTAHITTRKHTNDKTHQTSSSNHETDKQTMTVGRETMTKVTKSVQHDNKKDILPESDIFTRETEKKPPPIIVERRSSDTVTDEEIDSITNTMQKPNSHTKHVKGRKSFPLDNFSTQSPALTDNEHSPTHNRTTRLDEMLTRSSKTPPKSSTSEALATFVARRRTLSPFVGGKSRSRIRTSPMANDNIEVAKETVTKDNMVAKEAKQEENMNKRGVNKGKESLERASTPKNYSKEPISVKLDFETDV